MNIFLQICGLVLLSFIQLPVPMVLGRLDGLSGNGPALPQATLRGGSPGEMHAFLLSSEGGGHRAVGFQSLAPAQTGTLFQIFTGGRT